MHVVNLDLLKMAQAKTGFPMHDFQSLISKQAVVAPPDPNAPPPGADPAAMGGGMPPGMPPGGPPGAPPMDPAMMAAMGGATAGMPAQAGMPPAMPTPMDPAAAAAAPAPAAPAPAKAKAEDWLPKLDTRLYNVQQMLSAVINHLGIPIPPEALIMPPGTTTPQMEQAMPTPGMPPAQPPMDPAAAGGGGDPMAAAMGGGAPPPMDPSQGKTANSQQFNLMEMLFEDKQAVSSRAQAISSLLRTMQGQ